MKEKLAFTFASYWAKLIGLVPGLAVGAIILIVFVALGMIFGGIFKRRLKQRDSRSIVTNFGGDILKWTFWMIGGIIAMHAIGFGGLVSSLLAGAGISAIIIGFAFKDIAENFLAGLLLAFNRPFKSGDIIEIDGNKGVVKDVDLRTVHIRVADGRDIYIPNSMMVSNVLTNYTKDGLIRNDFPIGLDTEADLVLARKIVMETLQKVEGILTNPPPEMLVEEIAESSLNVRALFWVDQFNIPSSATKGGPKIKSLAIMSVRDALLANGFTLPSVILEHKIYKEDAPIPITLIKKEE